MAKDRVDGQLDELQFRAWRAFLYAYATVVPTLDRELVSAQGLSLNQFEVLTWLRRAGKRGLRMSDLASRIVLSPSGVTRAVDQLERKGLVDAASSKATNAALSPPSPPRAAPSCAKPRTFICRGCGSIS